MPAQVLTVEPDVGHVHRRVELQEELSARALATDDEALAVPAGPLPLEGVAPRFPGHQALDACRVRERRRAPGAVVERAALRTFRIAPEEPPTRIEVQIGRARVRPRKHVAGQRRVNGQRGAGHRRVLHEVTPLHLQSGLRVEDDALDLEAVRSLPVEVLEQVCAHRELQAIELE